ncbi:MAG TPA: UDP-N-acetylmuramoyl-L-alanyl-D-glutamate--2,6-diaminopimelate ligase [Solirubrobacterales bacterium]|jgi:UDP-N-acetylmuramoyl-L-alanyl-D-glutamate--2,6-diaminopimelate ligase|nr:UDP-N-acetylmuramoyl-L-alanyl-D-glutamate--2,6-diaminopimelate ligase [Solirubrobacterales bacterium]
MELGTLVRASGVAAEIRGDEAVQISKLAYDSRAVEPGTLFFCFPGEQVDRHEFAPQAVQAGACALVVERPLELGVPEVQVDDARAAMAPLAAAFYGDPTAELVVAGVTGTNGKTTTAFLIRRLLEGSGRQCGLLGTVQRVVGGEVEPVERTTPEAIDLQATFARMLEAGDRACVMEVSSHALVLHRADAINFDAKVFTNLTQDHLDFHADMEDYFAAKRLLFTAEGGSPTLVVAGGVSVINVDDAYGARLAAELLEEAPEGCLTFSAAGAEADFSARDVSFDATGSTFACVTPEGTVRVRTPLPGDFNVENALAAIAAGHALGVAPQAAAAALAEVGQVPGRFEAIEEGQPFTVLVDYAHTPDSLENVLEAAGKLTEGRLVSVFGCGGDRDRDKRPLMGRAAAELSDLAVVTSDNPRSERPEAIIEAILAGIEAIETARAEVVVEPDRRAAIGLAFSRAAAGDTVVIAGKGHEQGQEFEGGRKIPFDDRDVAREELRRLTAERAVR